MKNKTDRKAVGMDHHAYLYEGSMSEFGALKQELRPFVAQLHERFGIDEARELVAQATLKRAGETIFLVGASSITTEAQQALLKLLEEPQEGIVFVLLVPHGSLLPTLRSRMMEYREAQKSAPAPLGNSQRSRPQISAFLKASQKERSDMIAALLKDDEGVRERVRDFVNALERELTIYIKDARAREGLQDLARVRDYLRDRSPSLKMLLEHLALSLPHDPKKV